MGKAHRPESVCRAWAAGTARRPHLVDTEFAAGTARRPHSVDTELAADTVHRPEWIYMASEVALGQPHAMNLCSTGKAVIRRRV